MPEPPLRWSTSGLHRKREEPSAPCSSRRRRTSCPPPPLLQTRRPRPASSSSSYCCLRRREATWRLGRRNYGRKSLGRASRTSCLLTPGVRCRHGTLLDFLIPVRGLDSPGGRWLLVLLRSQACHALVRALR